MQIKFYAVESDQGSEIYSVSSLVRLKLIMPYTSIDTILESNIISVLKTITEQCLESYDLQAEQFIFCMREESSHKHLDDLRLEDFYLESRGNDLCS